MLKRVGIYFRKYSRQFIFSPMRIYRFTTLLTAASQIDLWLQICWGTISKNKTYTGRCRYEKFGLTGHMCQASFSRNICKFSMRHLNRKCIQFGSIWCANRQIFRIDKLWAAKDFILGTERHRTVHTRLNSKLSRIETN